MARLPRIPNHVRHIAHHVEEIAQKQAAMGQAALAAADAHYRAEATQNDAVQHDAGANAS